jgi:hypothetical protein
VSGSIACMQIRMLVVYGCYCGDISDCLVLGEWQDWGCQAGEERGTRDYAGRVHVLGIGAKTGPEC